MNETQDVSGDIMRAHIQGRPQETASSAAAAAANAAMAARDAGQDEEPMYISAKSVTGSGRGGQAGQGGKGAGRTNKPVKYPQPPGPPPPGAPEGFDPSAFGMGCMGYPAAGQGMPMHPGLPMMYPGVPFMAPQMYPGAWPGMDVAGCMGGYPYPMPPMMYPPAPAMGPQSFGARQQKPFTGERRSPGHLQQQNAGREQRKRGRGGKGSKSANEPEENAEDSAMAAANRPAVLTEVRKSGGKCNLPLSEWLPYAIEFAQDQYGSSFLNARLAEADADGRQAVLVALLPEAGKLAADVHANVVIQKYFDVGTMEQKRSLSSALRPDLLKLSCETYGCRVVQKAIQHVPRESQLLLAAELKDSVIACIDNMHGNHVIQKCIEQMPPDSVTFIIQAIEEQTERMAMNMYGCRVIQRLLEHCGPHQLRGMLEKILESTLKLCQDSYGNYVVQHVLEHGRKEDKKRIIRLMSGNIHEYSKHKCSSNVVEKCVEIATIGEHAQALEEERAVLANAILIGTHPGDPNPPINFMMEDRYGNYVVQRMIEHSKGSEREILKQKIEAFTPQLTQSTVGKHILDAKRKEFGS